MESRVITVGIWSAVVIHKWGLIPLQLNPLRFLHKMLNPAAGAAAPWLWREENWSLEVQSSLTWYYFITCCLQLQQLIPETSILPLKKPQSSFLHWSPYGLCIEVCPVQAKGPLCTQLKWFSQGLSTTVKAKRGLPCGFWTFGMDFFISALLKRWSGSSFYFPAALCSRSSACTGWAVPYEPCSQQQSLGCAFVSQQLPGILKIYALFT